MRARSIAVVTTSLVLAAAALGCVPVCPPCVAAPVAPVQAAVPVAAVATSAATAPKAQKPPEQRRVYRLDFVLTTTEVGKSPVSSSYTLNVEEEQHGELRLGMNVPLQSSSSTGSVPRQDVGLNFRASYVVVGEDLLLHNNVEMSSVEENFAIRKLSSNGDVVVSPGKPALVSTLEDPSSHKRFQVMVSATKLR